MGGLGVGPRASILLLLLFFFLLDCCCAKNWAPPLVRVNLDSNPQQRWEEALRLYDPVYLRQAMKHIISELVPEWVHTIIKGIADELERFIHSDYAEEIRGISKAIGCNVGDAFLLNLCYESTTLCTSIIAQDLNGTIYHGRNLDYFFKEYLQNATIDVQFMKNGQVAYTGTTFIAYVGLWTGQSPHKFTVSGNQRGQGDRWKTVIAALLGKSSPVSWLIRNVLNEAEDFQSAVLMLAKIPILADVYYIVAGTSPKEGVVITRNRNGPKDIWPLDPLFGGWFRVETNYDHWTTPPSWDDRRTPAIKALNATGQENINLDTLYKVLSVNPVLNNLTVYTTVMSADYPDQYSTRIRNDTM